MLKTYCTFYEYTNCQVVNQEEEEDRCRTQPSNNLQENNYRQTKATTKRLIEK